MLSNEFYYLVITDTVLLPFGVNYPDYEKREPGYGQSWLSAYNYAFQMPKDGKITPELLLGVNAEAMSFQKDDLAGRYRDIPVNFQIGPAAFHDKPEALAPAFSCSSKGINEFIDYWLFKTPQTIHSISFVKPAEKIGFMISKQDKNKIKWLVLDAGRDYCEWLDLEAHTKKVDAFLGDSTFSCFIDCMPDVEEKLISFEVERHLQRIIEEFEQEMPTAKSEDDKITVIAKHIQHIAQLHPFNDGNIRTCYIVLNKLLRDYDLPLTILLNANRFDCCSLREVVDMIKQGQQHYQQLLQHQKGDFRFISETERDEYKLFTVKPARLINVDEKIIDRFTAVVIESKPLKISTVVSSPHSLFAPKLMPSELLIEQLRRIDSSDKISPVIRAIEDGTYNVAFRKACAAGSSSVIKTIFRFQGLLNIDLQEPSSNGKTPYRWLMSNSVIGEREKLGLLTYLKNYSPTDASFAPK